MIATAQPASPPSSSNVSPRNPRRPSISNPIAWLTRTSNTHGHSSGGGSTVSPLRISEPKLVNDLFTTTGGPTYTHARYGPLGTGATVVRTPRDALSRAMLDHAWPYPPQEPPGTAEDDGDGDASSYEDEDEPEPVSPSSPLLPPVPYASSQNLPALSEMGELMFPLEGRDLSNPTRAKPGRACPPVPSPKAPHPSPNMPMLPLVVPPAPPQPPFSPILLSPVPDLLLSCSSLIIMLETSTASFRTTYATLTSRPSNLASYLQSLARSAHERQKRNFRDTLVEVDEDVEDVDAENEENDSHPPSSPNSPFASLFAAHLTSAGLLPQSGGMIHLFLDRPSAPYAHILTYLRSPTPNAPLPRLTTLGQRYSRSSERLEALLELRDEAIYLGLEELHKLCCDELRRCMGHVRGGGESRSTSSTSSSIGSGSGNHAHLTEERGRDGGLVRLGAIVCHEVPAYGEAKDRESTGSAGHASAVSEVAHIESGPVTSPSTPVRTRVLSPVAQSKSRSQSRSRSGGQPLSVTDWI